MKVKSKGKKKGGKKGKGKKTGKTVEKKTPPVSDPFSMAAMLNAYYISHGPIEFLTFRGYSWEGGGVGGGTKRKKGKKGRKK